MKKISIFIHQFFLLFFLFPVVVLASSTNGTIDAVYKYAWSEKAGWINFGCANCNVHITDSGLTGYAWSENYGWINLNPTNSGVKNNSEGTLSGYAWGENLGWINFSGVSIDSNGNFSGIATGDNTSQISFNCANCQVKTDWRPQSARTTTTPTPTVSVGGGGSYIAPQTAVSFSGRAYPGSKVTLLKDAQIAASVLADPNAAFSISLSGLSSGDFLFSLYSEDSSGRRSSLIIYPINVTSGATVSMTGIFIAPTIAIDKSEVKKGENVAIFGQSVPQADITIAVNSDEEFYNKVLADANGAYLYNFDTSQLDMGQHYTKSKAAKDGAISSFSKAVSFLVSTKTVLAQPPTKCPSKADLNSDCRVNLVDFSIAAYWYKRAVSADFKKLEAEKLNGDGKVNLIDFSIMAFYWTG